eukprot:8138745-Heterocapsa_arctica.AAC.1
MLRHQGSRPREAYKSIIDADGWASTGAIAKYAKAPKLGLSDSVINLDTMLGIVLDDDKGRFQLGVLVAAPII